ncbi:MAG: PilZ domain-containing protein [Acidobacteriota bacterium]|nr:PilZ domain-containing protein [Acidobacteriota bacterium]
MAEKRDSPRRRCRLLVDFDTTLSRTTGFTHDVSKSGIFVRTIRIPKIGKVLRAILHMPAGGTVSIEGTVVRSFRAPGALRTLIPSGFVLRVAPEHPSEYDEIATPR